MQDPFERERLAALERLEVLDTPSEPLFDSLTELAARTFNTPIALISLLDQKRQWFKARIGLDVDHTARDLSFCQHAILSDEVFVVPDTAKDERFRDNPLVKGRSAIRFYAGAPLITPDGYRLGTVCVIDTVAREFTDADASRLRAITKSIMQALLLRRDSLERERMAIVAQQTKLLKLAEDMAGVGTWSWDVSADRKTWSDQVYRILGYEPGVEPPPLEGVLEQYHPDDARVLADHVQRAVSDGQDYALQARIYRPDRSERHVLARGACRKDEDGAVTTIVGTFQDITEHVAAERFIRAVTDNIPGMVGYWDSELRCRFANAAYGEWLGHTSDSVLGLALPQLLGPALFAKDEQHIRAALNGQSQIFPQTSVDAFGEVVHTLTHYIPDIDAAGRTQGFYVLASDVTALKQAEEKLKEIVEQREKLIDGLMTSNVERDQIVRQLGERQADLRRTSERHKQLINGVDDYAIYWLDPTGHVESWNTGAQRMKGYEEGEIIGQHYRTFFSAGDRAAGEPERILSTARRDGKCSAEGWRVRKDGSAFWAEVSVEAVYDDAGALIGFAKVSRDVSERQALERSRAEAHEQLEQKSRALAASEEGHVLALKGMSVGVWDLDFVNNRFYWSEKFMQMLGIVEADFIPSYDEFADRLHPDDKKATENALRRHLERKSAYDVEYRLRHNKGHYIWVHGMGQATWNERGEPRRMMGSVSDITKFKRQQRALIESEETFRRAVENAVVGNALVAPDGRWLKVNRALCALVGFKEADLLKGGDALIQHPNDPKALSDIVESLMSGASSVVEGERRLRHRDGHDLWVKVCASTVNRSDGTTNYLVIQFQDLTERKRAEIIKDEFVSTVNHELRTPLTSIFASLRLLGATTAGKLDPKSERLLQVAQTSCAQLTSLVNDILDIEKIAAGKIDYQMQTLEAGPLIRDIVNRHGAIADQYGVRFKMRLDVDDLAIHVDPSRFNQALVNLLSNAAKYSSPGDQVDIEAKRDGEAAMRISVTDHGSGIPEAFRSRIFGRFAQADNSTTRKVGGSGLGLNITKTLIEAFGGTVSFDSVEGQGATFHFVLPIATPLTTEMELQAHG